MLKSSPALFIFMILIPEFSSAQGIRSSADGTAFTEYEIGGKPDTIYAFSASNSNFVEAYTNGDTATITWEIYDTASGSYETLTEYTTRGISSRIIIASDAGYRVNILGNGNNVINRFWVMVDDISVEIYNGEISPDNIKVVPQSHKWCHLIRDIRARVTNPEIDYTYYHPQNGTEYYLKSVEFEVDWSDNPEAEETGINRFIKNDENFLEIDIEDPSWEDTWFVVTVSNLGISAKDSIFYESIEPHADFGFEYITLDNRTYYPDRSDLYYDNFYNSANYQSKSAPAMFIFRNLSVNGDNMLWVFGDSVMTLSASDSILHTYALPGTYKPKMVVYNEVEHLYESCADTFPKYDEMESVPEYPLVIDQSALLLHAGDDGGEGGNKMPNVFTCPGGENNYFRFEGDVSITFFEIVIYNRYGKKVYHYEGNIRDWEGWDGSDNNSKKYVPTGVYYYVVREITNMPDYKTGLRSRIQVYNNDGQSNQQQSTSGDSNSGNRDVINSLYKGFVHVYNTE